MLYFLDIATVVGFYAVSIPFMDRNSSLSGISQNERFRVSTVLIFLNITLIRHITGLGNSKLLEGQLIEH